jgi:protein-tyrosine-phosphatase
MGCEDACPYFPGVPNEEWDLEDPAEKPISFMRETRDEIEKKVSSLLADDS